MPIHKKGAKTACENYRGISLLVIAGKILTAVIRARLSDHYEANAREAQAGFRRGRGCTDQVFALRQICERRIRNNRRFFALFVDFRAAFDSIHRESHWKCLLISGVPRKIVNLLATLYEGNSNRVRAYGELSRPFEVTTGVRQGCIISPCLFNIVLDWILRKAIPDGRGCGN